MGVAREIPPIPTVFAGCNGRRHNRVRCISIGCSGGELLDLSASGARLLWRGRMRLQRGAVTFLTIEGIDNKITIRARVMWVKKLRWRRHEMGVEFEDLTEEAKKELVLIVRVTPRW
jgi:hypothetical protein